MFEKECQNHFEGCRKNVIGTECKCLYRNESDHANRRRSLFICIVLYSYKFYTQFCECDVVLQHRERDTRNALEEGLLHTLYVHSKGVHNWCYIHTYFGCCCCCSLFISITFLFSCTRLLVFPFERRN